MRNASDKSCRGNQNTHFIFNIFFFENSSPFMRMWKNNAVQKWQYGTCALHAGYLRLQIFTYLLTYSMVQSPSWEANRFAASQKIPRISRNPKVHYRTHKPPPPVRILGQPNPVHIPTSYILEIILILSTHLRLGLPSVLLPSGFPTKTLYTPLSSPIRATCPATRHILLDFTTRTILGEENNSFSSSLCSLLHFPVTSSLPGLNILLNTMFSNTLSFLSSLNVSDQVSHPYKTTGKITVLYILIFQFLDSNLEDKRFCTEW